MELWVIVDGWLVEHRHLLSKPDHIKFKVSAHLGIAWVSYKETIIMAIRSDHIVVMPPITDYYTLRASDPAFWNHLLIAINQCADQCKHQ